MFIKNFKSITFVVGKAQLAVSKKLLNVIKSFMLL